MYCDFYQLRERPFNVTADPKFLYLNARYREALASLNYGITQRKGFITLIGEAGTGKTTLLKKLLDDLDNSTRTVFIFNTNVSFDEILEYIFGEFDLPVQNGKRLYMLQRLNAFLLDELRQGRNVALLIDEAQDLDFSVLEDLRLLSNLETAKEKILQIVLSGQPELGQKIGNPGLRQLRQRVAVNCRLLPLTREELSEYVQSRLTAAGSADPKLFSRDAEERIFEISTGIPRLVNIVCDNALVIGYALGKKRIGADVVNEAAADLLSVESRDTSNGTVEAPVPVAIDTMPRGRSVSQLGVVAVVAVAILIGLLSVGRSLLRGNVAFVGRETSARRDLEVVPPGVRAEMAQRAEPIPPVHEAIPRARAMEGGDVGEESLPAAERQPAVESRPPARRVDDAVPPVRNALGEPKSSTEVDVPGGVAVDTRRGEPRQRVGVDLRGGMAVAEGSEDQQPAVDAPLPEVGEAQAGVAERRPAGMDAATVKDAIAPPDTIAQTADAARADRAPAPAAPAEDEAAREKHTQTAPRLAALEPPRGDPVDVASDEPAKPPLPEEGGDAVRQQGNGELRVALSRYDHVMVRPGDSVSQIASRTYGQASPTILDLMKMANPSIRDIDIISIGQELRLPQLDEGLALLQQADGRYALLLLSTPIESRARDIGSAIRRHGFDVKVARSDFGRGHSVWRVMIGDLTSRDNAHQVGKQLQQLLREDERIAAMAE